jgi:histidine triad (HIT) family protein
MAASDCIFCRIASGRIPAARVLETDEAVAFLDVGPLAPGHTLLIPRTHYENLLDVPVEVLAKLAAHLPRLAGAILAATGAGGMNLLQNSGASSGQAVFHLHFHLIPRREGDSLGYRWNPGTYAPGEADALRGRILAQLSR